ncbi:MAG: acetate kinase [Deltaproteobacteria bacterium]|nr:acetate kinase [Deltaproteobacteria bacterium]
MRVVVVNAGSSSIKYEVFALDGCTSVVQGSLERIGTREAGFRRRWLTDSESWEDIVETRPIADHYEGFQYLLDVAERYPTTRVAPGAFFGFGHRVVHGGEAFREPVIVDEDVICRIKDLIPLAPLHNPPNVAGIEALRKLRPDVPNVAVFDTAFHQSMPPKAFHYALPHELHRLHHVRRYGFHGTSHQYVTQEASNHLGIPLDQLNLITLHFGNGASAIAVRGGKSADTSMGLTPLEGLIMGTRCGDLDPAVHFYLARKTGMTFEAMEEILNKESGHKGICGLNDMREIQRCAEEGDAQAGLAIEMFCYRVKKYIGAYTAVLGRVDAVIFTGGIGENATFIWARVCEGLEHLGIAVDGARNEAVSGTVAEIQKDRAPVRVLVVRTDEELEIARQTIRTIEKSNLSKNGII